MWIVCVSVSEVHFTILNRYLTKICFLQRLPLFLFQWFFFFCVLAMSFGFVCLYDVDFHRFSSTSKWLSVRAHVLMEKEKKKENKKGKTSIRLFKKYELKRGLVSDKRFLPFSCCYTIASIVPVSFSQYYILILNLSLSLDIFRLNE